MSVTSTGQLMSRLTGVAGTTAAIGNTSSAENRPLSAPQIAFWMATSCHRHGRQDAVFDLAGVAELLHHRQRDRLDALHEDRDPDDTGDEQGRESGSRVGAADALADLREHVREHEDEQQRLEDRARDELLERLAQHDEVAQQQRAERDPGRSHGLAGWDGDARLERRGGGREHVTAVIRGGPSR